jgi:23S rRNA (adenine2503-C2)-methyltransferase
LRGRPALLNVIPYNPVAGLPFQTPSPADQQQFRRILEDHGVNVQFRERKGDAIDAACGQLRRGKLEWAKLSGAQELQQGRGVQPEIG